MRTMKVNLASTAERESTATAAGPRKGTFGALRNQRKGGGPFKRSGGGGGRAGYNPDRELTAAQFKEGVAKIKDAVEKKKTSFSVKLKAAGAPAKWINDYFKELQEEMILDLESGATAPAAIRNLMGTGFTVDEVIGNYQDEVKSTTEKTMHEAATKAATDAGVKKILTKLGISEQDFHVLARAIAKSNKAAGFTG